MSASFCGLSVGTFIAATDCIFSVAERFTMDIDAVQKESAQKNNSVPVSINDKLAEKKRSIRALKRVLIAKAEVRRLRALTQAKCVGSRR